MEDGRSEMRSRLSSHVVMVVFGWEKKLGESLNVDVRGLNS